MLGGWLRGSDNGRSPERLPRGYGSPSLGPGMADAVGDHQLSLPQPRARRSDDIMAVAAASATDAAVDEDMSVMDEAAIMVTSKADETVDEAVIVDASSLGPQKQSQTCQRPENLRRFPWRRFP